MANDIIINADNMANLTQKAFKDCLFQKDEDTINLIMIKVLIFNFALHKQRLERKRELVAALVAELSNEFKKGSTLQNLCFTKDGEQWTDLYYICEQLLVMAIGLCLMEFFNPIDQESYFPSSIFYVRIK